MRPPHTLLILVAICLFVMGIRGLVYYNLGTPLGYDAGLYKHAIDTYASSLPNLPAGMPSWMVSMYPPGLFLLTDGLYSTGIGTAHLAEMLLLIIGSLLVFPIFLVAREFFGEKAGILAAVLYALSATQFQVFSLFYLKNLAGLFLMLVSLYLLKKKAYGLLVLCYVALGAYHRPTFLILTLVLVARMFQSGMLYMKTRKYSKGLAEGKDEAVKLLLVLLFSAVLLLPPYYSRADVDIGILSSAVTGPGGGTFISLEEYSALALAYLPFSLIGIYLLCRKRDFNLVLIWALINLAIVLFRLLFYRRNIIPLDLALIILAGYGLGWSLSKARRRWGLGAVMLAAALILVNGAILYGAIMETPQEISRQGFESISWLSGNTEPASNVLTISNQAPWVLGWSDRNVIAPGVFERDSRPKDEWRRFFVRDCLEETKDFLEAYGRPLYVHYSKEIGLNEAKFENECFEKVYENRESMIYRYLC